MLRLKQGTKHLYREYFLPIEITVVAEMLRLMFR